MVVALQEMQAATDATHKQAVMVVLIDGIATDATDVTVRHAVAADPVGTCSIEMHAPIPAHVALVPRSRCRWVTPG